MPEVTATYSQREDIGFIFLFVIGIIAGFLVGSLLEPEFALVPNIDIDAISSSKDTAYKDTGSPLLYFALLLIFSTSYLGLILIPCLFFLRGYFFSCSLTALYTSLGPEGLLFSLFSSAVPLCILLPYFFRIGSDCFALSRNLAELKFGGSGSRAAVYLYRHLLSLLPLLIIERLYAVYLLPTIISKFF